MCFNSAHYQNHGVIEIDGVVKAELNIITGAVSVNSAHELLCTQTFSIMQR